MHERARNLTVVAFVVVLSCRCVFYFCFISVSYDAQQAGDEWTGGETGRRIDEQTSRRTGATGRQVIRRSRGTSGMTDRPTRDKRTGGQTSGKTNRRTDGQSKAE